MVGEAFPSCHAPINHAIHPSITNQPRKSCKAFDLTALASLSLLRMLARSLSLSLPRASSLSTVCLCGSLSTPCVPRCVRYVVPLSLSIRPNCIHSPLSATCVSSLSLPRACPSLSLPRACPLHSVRAVYLARSLSILLFIFLSRRGGHPPAHMSQTNSPPIHGALRRVPTRKASEALNSG